MKRLLTWLALGLGAMLIIPALAAAAVSTAAQPAATVVVGTALSDQATVTLATPTVVAGTVTFRLYGPDSDLCATEIGAASSTVPMTLDTATSGSATATPFTPTQPGVYRWIATYDGDGGLNPPESGLCDDAGENQVVQAQPTIATAATDVTLGQGNISDIATLPGLHNPTATGSVTFNVYGPGDTACANPLAAADAVALDPVTGTATATGFTPLQAGTYRWVASYSGDDNNAPVSGACGDLGETSTVAPATPTITTLASAGIAIGAGTLSDLATVSATVSPTGPQTVTFNLYGPDDTTCAAPAAFTNTVVLADATAQSAAFTPTTAGVYRWRATYDGDANNAAVTGACNEATETRTVLQATPAIATLASPAITLGGTLSDDATVSGLANASAGANVTFELFGPGDTNCAGPAVFSSIQSGLLDVAQTTLSAQSGDATPTAAGVYRWRATFNGDVNNTAVVGACGGVDETRTVGKATAVITSRASGAIALGAGTLTDEVTLAGVAGTAPAGSVTFQLFGPDDAQCTGGTVFTNSQGLTAAGQDATATSAPYTPTASGVYRWRVVFLGDANFLGAATACNDAGESAAVGPPVPPPAAPSPVVVGAAVPPPPPPPPPRPAPARAICNALVATIVGTGQARLTGTPGDDVIVGSNAAETIDGGGGDDTICAGGGADRVTGGADQDVIFGGAGNDQLRGGGGNDRVFGEDGADLVLGNAGDDDLHGGRGGDRLAGGDGFDSVDGEAGDDLLDEQQLGGAGRDRLLGGSGGDRIRTRGGSADVVDCGSGRDTVTLDRSDRQKRCENVRR